MHPIRHFKTISYHKWLVMSGCFKIGLFWQGLTHDLSKYLPSEFWVGAKYYQGNRSPNNAEREDIGYSAAWLHHKGRNKHHYEYWLDFSMQHRDGGVIPCPMPDRYIAEMLIDRIAACKVYNRGHYSDDLPLKYYEKGRLNADKLLHPYTQKHLYGLLKMLNDKGEKETFRYIREDFLKHKKHKNQSVISK